MLNSLDSRDEMEAQAAIEALEKLCKVSANCAVRVGDRIGEIVNRLNTPTSLKGRLLQLFGHFTGNALATVKVATIVYRLERNLNCE